jgi:exopolysaccharide biosynthesis polyprenyl glycosylphosphotransferase
MAAPAELGAPATPALRARSLIDRATGSPLLSWAPRRGHILGGSAAGLLVSWLHGAQPVGLAVVGLGLWASATLASGTPRSYAVRLRTSHALGVAALTFATMAALACTGLLPLSILPATLVTLGTAAVTAIAWSLVRSHRMVRALLVGDDDAVESQIKAWAGHPRVQIVSTYAPTRETSNSESAGESVAAVASELGVQAVIVAPGPRYTAADLQRLSWELEQTGTTILLGGIVDRVAPHRLASATFGGVPVITVGPSRRCRWVSSCKGALDRMAAAVLLAALSPLLLLLAVAIRLESPGPAIFKQQRVGMNGRPFVMLKLRTMRVGGPIPQQLRRTAGNDVLFKMRDDPRVTRLGSLLRKSSLDELPQLVNVLRGEMSLVGPRPALFEETTKYDREAWRRTAVKPGITGLWQVSGRSDLSWEESIALDVNYVDNWRLSGDAIIALRTVGAVVGRKGAY